MRIEGSNPPPTYPKPPAPPPPPPPSRVLHEWQERPRMASDNVAKESNGMTTDERLLSAVESIAERLRLISEVAVAPEPDEPQDLDEPANPLRTMDG